MPGPIVSDDSLFFSDWLFDVICAGDVEPLSLCWLGVLRGDTRPFCIHIQVSYNANMPLKDPEELTCLAHRRPQLLHRSRFPLGPLLHSGVTRV